MDTLSSTKSFAVRYRPKTFSDICGNKATLTKLKGMVSLRKLPSAILLSGMTGCGKTTMARMLSYYLNCDTLTACGKCPSCKIPLNSHPDISELNLGESRGIDDIRTLLQKIRYHPRVGHIKVFILDECHNMTHQAANAFLKPLEDTPPKVLWILATTDVLKLPDAIRNRCVNLEVSPLQKNELVPRLRYIADKQGMDYISEDNLDKISELSGGFVREAITLLEATYYYVNGLSDTDTTKDSINTIIDSESQKIIGANVDIVAIKTLIRIYKGSYRKLLDTILDTEDYIALVNRMLFINQYLIEIKSELPPSKKGNIWHTSANLYARNVMDKNIGLAKISLKVLFSLQKNLSEIRWKMQTTPVNPKVFITSELGNLAISRAQQRERSIHPSKQ